MSKSQSELPGVERKTFRDIEDAVDEYIKTCDKLKGLSEDKKEGAAKLVIAMRRNKVTSYRYDGHVITLEELEKVRVKDAVAKDPNDDD